MNSEGTKGGKRPVSDQPECDWVQETGKEVIADLLGKKHDKLEVDTQELDKMLDILKPQPPRRMPPLHPIKPNERTPMRIWNMPNALSKKPKLKPIKPLPLMDSTNRTRPVHIVQPRIVHPRVVQLRKQSQVSPIPIITLD